MASTSTSLRCSQASTRSMRERIELTFQVAIRTQATLCGPAYSGCMSTALVTGATAGIGPSFAPLLAERGHDVVLVARDRPRLETGPAGLKAKYGAATGTLVADLSDRAETGKVAERIADRARP